MVRAFGGRGRVSATCGRWLEYAAGFRYLISARHGAGPIPVYAWSRLRAAAEVGIPSAVRAEERHTVPAACSLSLNSKRYTGDYNEIKQLGGDG